MNRQVTTMAQVVTLATFLLMGAIVTAQDYTERSVAAGVMVRMSATQNNSTMTTTATRATLSVSDRKFVMEAAMGGMAEVELGKLATKKGTSDAVKAFGQRMVDDHSAANADLTTFASAKGVSLPTALDAKHRAAMARLSRLSGAAFDRGYARDMLADHVKDVAAFKRQSKMGRDADLRAFAGAKLPTLEEHLRMARDLNGMKP
jgi:putative membrane protein